MKKAVVYTRRVRFSDIDCQGHVFNANYFVYFDDAITDFFDAIGLPHDAMLKRGHDLVLAHAECGFRSSAALGETVRVRAGVEKVGNTSLVFGLRIEEEGTGRLVAEGREVYVILDAATRAPVSVPAYLREAVEERAGEAAAVQGAACWLVKTEPEEYSYGDLEREGRGVWDGVTNALALKHLRAMRPGDGVLVYHSGKERAAVGLAVVAGEPRPDPGDGGGKLWVVDLKPAAALPRPVPLQALKADPLFEGSPLVRQGRLSVVPLTREQWDRVLALAAGA